MAVIFFFQTTVIHKLSLIPDSLDVVAIACRDHWWSFFLYVQNYVNPTEIVRILA